MIVLLMLLIIAVWPAASFAASPPPPNAPVLADRVLSDDQALYLRLCSEVAAAYDSTRGGFVDKDGVPSESAVELAFALGRERPDTPWKQWALHTARWTISLYDSVGGGFLHGAKDADHFNASFAKWTTDNSRRIEMMLEAHRASGDPTFKRVARNAVDYADRVLLDGRGGFVHGQVGDRQLVPESNGWAIVSWMEWGGVIDDVRMRNFAWKSLDRMWEGARMEGPGMVRKGVFGELEEEPQLLDQIEMIRGFAFAAHLAGRASDLERAKSLADGVLAWAQPGCGMRSKAMPDKKGGLKRAGCKYEENARAARVLAQFASVAGESKYRAMARQIVKEFAETLEKDRGLEGAEWALALRAIRTPDLPRRIEWREPSAKASAKPAAKKGKGR